TPDAGIPFIEQPVAAFTDPGGPEVSTDYQATINWGDGSSPVSGHISGPDSTGRYTVTGSYVYATAGTDTITVTIHHDVAIPDTVVTTQAVVFDATGALSGFAFVDPSGTGAPTTAAPALANRTVFLAAGNNTTPAATDPTTTTNAQGQYSFAS